MLLVHDIEHLHLTKNETCYNIYAFHILAEEQKPLV